MVLELKPEGTQGNEREKFAEGQMACGKDPEKERPAATEARDKRPETLSSTTLGPGAGLLQMRKPAVHPAFSANSPTFPRLNIPRRVINVQIPRPCPKLQNRVPTKSKIRVSQEGDVRFDWAV